MKSIILVIFLIVLNIPGLYAQVAGASILDSKELLQMDVGSQIDSDKLLSQEKMPVGNSINPDYYIIGPEDVLSVQAIPYNTSPKLIYVSPDCSVLLPRLGEVNIKGLTLTQVRDTINKLYKKLNPNAESFITLRDSRKCLINIQGNVLTPSIYTMPASYQVSTAITFANRFSTKESSVSVVQMESVLKLREKKKDIEKLFSGSGLALESEYWRRNIKVVHNDGTTQSVDLERALVSGNRDLDPYLREGDEIIVPFDQQYYSKISISGSVVRPVILAYKDGDMASHLLKFGYGFSEDADLNNIKLFMPESGKEIKLKSDSVMNLLSEDFRIEPGTKIIVGQKNNFKPQVYGTITIRGNVKSPGSYLIKLNETRLKDIVKNAGGFTEDAYLPLSKIFRRQDVNSSLIDPRKEIFETMQYSDLKSDDTTRFYIDIQYKKPIVAADFDALFNHNSEIDNVLLQDGDIIVVPSSPGYVEIMGQVKNPGIVEFENGKNMLWYIQRAGGFAEGSEDFRARIVRGRTNVWIEGDEHTIVNAGDRIYVPRVPDEPTTVKLQRYTVYASIIATVSGLLNLIYLMSR